MLKKVFMTVVCLTTCMSFAFAQTVDEHTAELMDLLKEHRSSIYERLDLTPEQAAQIGEMDEKLYAELEPEMKKLSVMVKRIEDIANSENCTKEAVLAVKKEFKGVEKGMVSIKKQYVKDFKKVLTAEQKSQYRVVRAQKQAELKLQMQQQQMSGQNMR